MNHEINLLIHGEATRFKIKHGHARTKTSRPTRLYSIWGAMIRRCESPKHKHYHNYGGRGINVCQRWRNSFSDFLADMGPTYKAGLTIERINNDLGYNKENCRWATRAEQRRNNRFLRIIDTPKGRMCMKDAALEFGINRRTLTTRLERGEPDPFNPTLLSTHRPNEKRARFLETPLGPMRAFKIPTKFKVSLNTVLCWIYRGDNIYEKLCQREKSSTKELPIKAEAELPMIKGAL